MSAFVSHQATIRTFVWISLMACGEYKHNPWTKLTSHVVSCRNCWGDIKIVLQWSVLSTTDFSHISWVMSVPVIVIFGLLNSQPLEPLYWTCSELMTPPPTVLPHKAKYFEAEVWIKFPRGPGSSASKKLSGMRPLMYIYVHNIIKPVDLLSVSQPCWMNKL